MTLRPANLVFGLGGGSEFTPRLMELGPRSTRIVIEDVDFTLPIPGLHNAANAVAALAACRAVGADLKAVARGLEHYQGVARRYQCLGSHRGIEVIDDFAHNPAKVAAMLESLHGRSSRIHAIFQPHGFTQTRLLRGDYRQVFGAALRPDDRLHLLDIYFAGGTVTRDVASTDLIADLADAPFAARHAPDRKALAQLIAQEAQAGDLVVLMGARDPSLGHYARQLLEALDESSIHGESD